MTCRAAVFAIELRIIFGIRLRGDRGVEGFAPGEHQFVQFSGFLRETIDEVLAFADIVLEVVKFQGAIFNRQRTKLLPLKHLAGGHTHTVILYQFARDLVPFPCAIAEAMLAVTIGAARYCRLGLGHDGIVDRDAYTYSQPLSHW
jgi:hypothetical protein